MANQDEIRKLLKQGVDAARDGDREKAREILQQVTDLDSGNERAWYLLANLTDDPEEKRIYLENVLYVNPNNEKAQQMLDRLAPKASDSKDSGGPSNRRLLYIGAGIAIVWVILEATLIGVGQNRRSNATATAISFAATSTQSKLIADENARATATSAQATTLAQQAEATGVVLTMTATVVGTDTPTFDPIQLTLPPTFTPTPDSRESSPTPAGPSEERVLPLPPPDVFAGQILVARGGLRSSEEGYLPLRIYLLDEGGEFQTVNNLNVRDVDINPANGQTLLYVRFFPQSFGPGLERINLNGTEAQLVSDYWKGIEFLLEAQQAMFSMDGTKIVFIATDDNASRDVWLLNLQAPPVPNQAPLKRLTIDGATYNYPSVSPDGSQVAVVRTDPDSFEPDPDIVLIDVETLQQTRLTNDGSTLVETHSRFEPDGETLLYVGSEGSEDAPGDIIRLLSLEEGALGVPVILEPSDERTPVVSPDGRYLAYASDRTGVFNIFIRDLQTEEEYQLTEENFDPVFPGGWYQPNVIPEVAPILPIPTPVILSPTEEGEGAAGS